MTLKYIVRYAEFLDAANIDLDLSTMLTRLATSCCAESMTPCWVDCDDMAHGPLVCASLRQGKSN